ncbi:hypothetical protein BKA70DRAFT_1565379 [Coprinopsis sp. MPI-PUGE-AT-0042]|nr:hypothetical protein BKA70DRAFT_1565379 [Coprinopsis sp. MPI-PUGE-AT-0042]
MRPILPELKLVYELPKTRSPPQTIYMAFYTPTGYDGGEILEDKPLFDIGLLLIPRSNQPHNSLEAYDATRYSLIDDSRPGSWKMHRRKVPRCPEELSHLIELGKLDDLRSVREFDRTLERIPLETRESLVYGEFYPHEWVKRRLVALSAKGLITLPSFTPEGLWRLGYYYSDNIDRFRGDDLSNRPPEQYIPVCLPTGGGVQWRLKVLGRPLDFIL